MNKDDAKRCAQLSLDFADLKLKDIPEYKELSEDSKNLLRVICASLLVSKVVNLVVNALEEIIHERHH